MTSTYLGTLAIVYAVSAAFCFIAFIFTDEEDFEPGLVLFPVVNTFVCLMFLITLPLILADRKKRPAKSCFTDGVYKATINGVKIEVKECEVTGP